MAERVRAERTPLEAKRDERIERRRNDGAPISIEEATSVLQAARNAGVLENTAPEDVLAKYGNDKASNPELDLLSG